MEIFSDLFSNVLNFTWQQGLMIAIGCLLVYLAVKREMEPSLLLPMGFGAVLVNLPMVHTEAIETLFNTGIASELFPLLLLFHPTIWKDLFAYKKTVWKEHHNKASRVNRLAH